MSSKRAMKQAQKLAFAKHRSNISSNKLDANKTKIFNKINKKNKKS